MKSIITICFSALLAFFLIPPVTCAAQDPGYRVLHEYHFPSAGGWDYINVYPEMKRVYVSHGNEVIVMDERSGDSIGVIPNTLGVHGIVFAPEYNKGFVSDGRLNKVTVFDLKTNQVLDSVSTGQGPDGILYDDYSKKVIVNDGRSQDMTMIDASNNQVVKTLPLGGRPETAVSDGAGNIYVNIESKNEVEQIRTSDWTILQHWPIGQGDSPSGLAIDRKHHRLFIGCDNKLMIVMNAETGAVLAQLPIGNGCDGTDFDPGPGYGFSSNGEGTLTIVKEVSPDVFAVVANVTTKRGARTSTVDTRNHHLFLPTAEFGPTPDSTADRPHPRPPMLPGTFEVLEVGK
jgi:YVTN family beta-propeller protein